MALVKQVPDIWSEYKLTNDKFVLDRESADTVLDEISENAIEAAPQLKEGHDGNVTVAAIGPGRAVGALREALSIGADDAIILSNDALEGSDAVQAAWALSSVTDTLEDVDLIVTGSASTDGGTDLVPAILGVYRSLPVLTHLRSIAIDGNSITGERGVEDGIYQLKAPLPAVVSITKRANSPRFASLKGIMATREKPVTKLTLDDVAAEAEQVGLEDAATSVTGSIPRPAKTAGECINDEGSGGVKLAEYLRAQKFI